MRHSHEVGPINWFKIVKLFQGYITTAKSTQHEQNLYIAYVSELFKMSNNEFRNVEKMIEKLDFTIVW